MGGYLYSSSNDTSHVILDLGDQMINIVQKKKKNSQNGTVYTNQSMGMANSDKMTSRCHHLG